MNLLVLEHRFVSGWPENDDDRAGLMPVHELLTTRFDTDVHFVAYQAAIERRHTNASLDHAVEAGITMVAAKFDVDGPGHEGSDEWWEEQQEKIEGLLTYNDGGFVYRTKGGYHILFALPEPFPIRNEQDAAEWTRHYLAWLNYLERCFGIEADHTCKTWTRLYRAPHATRDGVLQELPTIGDPHAIGVWAPALSAEDWTVEPTQSPLSPPDARGPGAGGNRTPVAAMLGAAWPEQGRHGAQLALAGALYRDGWKQEDALEFLCDVCRHAGNEERPKREQTIRDTWVAGQRGVNLPGWSALQAHVPAAVVSSARDMLHPDADATAEFLELVNKPKADPAQILPVKSQKLEDGIFWDNWDEPLPPVEWLVEGLIPMGTVGGFVAHGSSLKTWTMLSIAAAIAQGKAWLNKYAVKQGKVVVLDYESGRYELRRRVLMLEGGKVVGLGAWSYPTKRIDDVEFWKELAEVEGVTLLCIDSLTEGSSPGVDQNSPEAAFPLQLAARYTEATGASVLFIHHSKKDDSGDARKVVRGSTAIYAAFDWCYAFENIEETTSLRRMMMTSIKPCMGAKPMPVPLELTDKGLNSFDVAQKPTKASPPEQIQAAIRLALSGEPVESKAKLAQQIGIRREIVTPELDAMVVRREVVFLKGRGFAIDSDDHRRERILDALRSYQHWTSEGKIARAADVTVDDIAACLREGRICKSADGRYLIVERCP